MQMSEEYKLNHPQTDAELVAAVAALDARVAVQVRARLRLLRLERVLLASHTVPLPAPGFWQSLHRAAARLVRHDLTH
jgi:hypothetical protein